VSARTVSWRDKSFPADLDGRPIDDLDAPLSSFSTPLFVLDGPALQHNIDTMAAWAQRRGLELMPHGKTTMAPELWRRQLAAGATGITVATGWQAEVALRAGVPTVQIANACTDGALLRRIADWLDEHPDQEVVSWADSREVVARMTAELPAGARWGVLTEIGAAHGRTGARDDASAIATAEAIAASDRLTLRGIAGYEGALAHDRSEVALAAVRAFCSRMRDLVERVRPLTPAVPWVTAGGSAFFDLVAEGIGGMPDARAILRSGAYLAHDSGFYRSISPLDPDRVRDDDIPLRTAMFAYARVVSQPEPGLALLDGGKRDLPFDEGLPVPLGIAGELGAPERPLRAEISAMNDQHAFLRWTGEQRIEVGEVVRLGLSHPCTAFDKWRLVPVTDGAAAVTEAVETYF
jgi:D-serine deaminase-like pyridoxal phosphate-dependent protein